MENHDYIEYPEYEEEVRKEASENLSHIFGDVQEQLDGLKIEITNKN